ncbi:unnamed protein product [Cylindrotheca closterium]|uniref:Uncharacterized protein n=1 Tax=Cylindrotheca closterium TaxID=2856 RepID=A0AAD2CR95_9STRA|nr:unnamed protein product [Cylindrotheca closterium]
MIRGDCRLVIIGAAATILCSLLYESRSLNSFRQPLHYTAKFNATRTSTSSTTSTTWNKNNEDKNDEIHPKRDTNKGTLVRSSSDIQQSWEKVQIPSNSNSTVASDVFVIWHDPENQSICVSLAENSRCPHPAFLGRLSGPSLALLEWKEESTGESSSEFVHCGSYNKQWLEPGTYFLDIIILFCNDFGINAVTRKQNESAWLSYDFQKDCLEDPTYNRITGEEAYVTIEEAIQSTPHLRPTGRWVSTNMASASIPKPLYTRYQPRHCRRNPQIERCAVPMNGTALESYSFEWENKEAREAWGERLKIAARTVPKMPKICLVGYSHSRFLGKSFNAIGLGKYVHHIQARYPSDISPWMFDHYHTNHSCTRFIVGVAQWPGSLMQGSPYLFDRFYTEMKRIVNVAVSTFADKEEDVKVYMRSIHHIPIGDVTGACPITDWRSPVVMDGYTHVIQKAVEEVKKKTAIGRNLVEFLDTRFIVSPMWDNAFDWIHLAPQVSDVEALYMAAIIYENILNDPKMAETTKNGDGAV